MEAALLRSHAAARARAFASGAKRAYNDGGDEDLAAALTAVERWLATGTTGPAYFSVENDTLELRLTRPAVARGRRLVLQSIDVAPARRRRGYATDVLHALQRWARTGDGGDQRRAVVVQQVLSAAMAEVARRAGFRRQCNDEVALAAAGGVCDWLWP